MSLLLRQEETVFDSLLIVVTPLASLSFPGCCHAKPKMVVGGRLLVFPCVQKIGRLPLNVITTKIKTNQVFTQLGVPINVTGTAQVRITEG